MASNTTKRNIFLRAPGKDINITRTNKVREGITIPFSFVVLQYASYTSIYFFSHLAYVN